MRLCCYVTKNSHYTKPPEVSRAWPTYIVHHGQFLVHLVFSDEKAWLRTVHSKTLKKCNVLLNYNCVNVAKC